MRRTEAVRRSGLEEAEAVVSPGGKVAEDGTGLMDWV